MARAPIDAVADALAGILTGSRTDMPVDDSGAIPAGFHRKPKGVPPSML
jgi:hypothetical protein